MGRVLDPKKEVLVVVDSGDVATRITGAIGDAGFFSVRARTICEARSLLDRGSVRPCVILVFLSPSYASELTELLVSGGPAAGIPLVMFSTGEEAPLLEPNPALVTTLVKMVQQHCVR
jgi:hypothetical protein